MSSVEERQRQICKRYGAAFLAAPPFMKLGLAPGVSPEALPINGLRHPPEPGTSGWFIWRGEVLSQEPGFFSPVHVTHVQEVIPEVVPFLGLAPGWRFLIAPGHEDVWFDPALLRP